MLLFSKGMLKTGGERESLPRPKKWPLGPLLAPGADCIPGAFIEADPIEMENGELTGMEVGNTGRTLGGHWEGTSRTLGELFENTEMELGEYWEGTGRTLGGHQEPTESPGAEHWENTGRALGLRLGSA